MRRPRIHTTQTLSDSASFELDAEASHYLLKVLRLKPGDPLALFNGDDGEFEAEIAAAGKKLASVQLGKRTRAPEESLLHVDLGLGLSRGERMDYAVQKATELGVSSITPIVTERCEVRLNRERAEKRVQHWSKIAISASEQCGRCRPPVICPPVALTEWLTWESRDLPAALKFVLDHSGSDGFTAEGEPGCITLLIGPEGGLTEEEVSLALRHGYKAVCLGPRILRTETAPVVALSLVQYLWGDL